MRSKPTNCRPTRRRDPRTGRPKTRGGQKQQKRPKPPDPEKIAIRTAAETVESFSDLLHFLEIENWDYFLIGDGSATRWIYQGGWASVLIENGTFKRRIFYGGFNKSTNIIAEMMAYVHPLMWLSSQDIDVSNSPIFVHIATDCEYLPFAAKNPQSRKKNRELWFMIDSFRRAGFAIRWHWVPRDAIDLNKLGHELANAARKQMKGLAKSVLVEMGARSLREFNPQ